MHWTICKDFGIEAKEDDMSMKPRLSPRRIASSLWGTCPSTDRTIAANRQNIVLKNKKDKTCLLIDMTIPLDTNTSVKTTEKLNVTNRKTWKSRLSAFWRLKTTTVPVVIGEIAHHQEGYGKLQQHLATSTYMNSRKRLFFLQPTFQVGPLHQVLSLKYYDE